MKFNNMMNYMKKFYRMIHKDHPRTLIYTIFGGIIHGIIPFISLYYSSKIIDSLLLSDTDSAIVRIVIMLSLVLILGCIDRAIYQALTVIADASYYSVWKQTSHKAYVMEYEEFEKTETMDKIRRAQNGSIGSGGVESQILDTHTMIGLLVSVFMSFIFTIQLFVRGIYSDNFIFYSCVIIFLFIVFFIFVNLVQKIMNQYEIELNHRNEHGNSISSYFISSCLDVKNGKDIRLFKMADMLLQIYKNIIDYVNKTFYDYAYKSGKDNAVIAFFTQLLAGFVYIYVGVSVLDGNISIGDVLLYTGAITSLATNLNQFIAQYNGVTYRFEYLGNFEEFISSKNMHYDGTLPIEKRDDHEYEFEFRNVSFKYPNTDHYVLRNINLKLNVNNRIAIVGQNGAGKTTLIKLLCRLYEPTEGEILLNGINIEKYDYEEYTRIFSVVFQDFRLFPLPLDENIAGSNEVDEERCMEVLDQVGLKEKVMNWPQQQKTRLYKNLGDGINVSGGEAQKIAIARALYKDAPFVIMDEPTAALDPIAESEIYENFNELIHNKTAIFISHRMSSCKFCDEIIVFQDGEIIQHGTHNELVEQEGLYHELWNAQAQYYA